MDRVLLTQKDLDMLFAWKEEHRDLVRTLPAPLRAVEITFDNIPMRIKGIRDGNKLTIYVNYQNVNRGKNEMEIRGDKLVSLRDTMNLKREYFEPMLTTYCTLMAFMVYEKPELVEPPAEPIKKHEKHEKRGKGAKKQKTYILRRRVAQVVSHGGHHASPKGIFTVRGHYRHLRDGRTIWIAEYKKGTGDKKSKTYKIGAMKNDDSASSGAKADAVV